MITWANRSVISPTLETEWAYHRLLDEIAWADELTQFLSDGVVVAKVKRSLLIGVKNPNVGRIVLAVGLVASKVNRHFDGVDILEIWHNEKLIAQYSCVPKRRKRK